MTLTLTWGNDTDTDLGGLGGLPPSDAMMVLRQWPAPSRPWIMAQTWHDLMFAHWAIPVADLRPVVPAALPLDTFEGQAWIGVVPFRMTGVRLRAMPSLPWVSAFPELNVRTYVTLDGKPGVYFFSLDATNRLAVEAARRTYFLPYYWARMDVTPDAPVIRYASHRIHRGAPTADFVATYRPVGEVFQAAPGSLDEWLVERYCLYTAGPNGRLYRGEIDHEPWPLQRAEAVIEVNSMVASLGLALPPVPPLLHFARRQQVRVWSLQICDPRPSWSAQDVVVS